MYGNKYLNMQYRMKTTNFSELRKGLKSILDAVINDSETVIINREGGNAVVMISLEEYNAMKETEYLMRSPETMEAIRRGIHNLEHNEVIRQQPEESIEEFLNRL